MAPKLKLLLVSLALLQLSHQVEGLKPTFTSVTTHKFNEETYTLVAQPKLNHAEAVQACQSKGLVLASARTKTEMDFYESLKNEEAFSEGYVRLFGSSDNQSNFWWMEDHIPVGDFWNPDEPKESKRPICVYLNKGEESFGLADGPCSDTTPFICRSQAKPPRRSTIPPKTTEPSTKKPTPKQTQPPSTKPPPTSTESPKSSQKRTLNTDLEHFCDGKDCGLYPDPANCAGHYQCVKDKTITNHKLCPNGLHYRIETKLCELSEFVDCQDRPILPPISCKDKPCGLYPDENDCAAYYICGDDKTVVEHKICEHGLLFHKKSQACDFAENVTC